MHAMIPRSFASHAPVLRGGVTRADLRVAPSAKPASKATRITTTTTTKGAKPPPR